MEWENSISVCLLILTKVEEYIQNSCKYKGFWIANAELKEVTKWRYQTFYFRIYYKVNITQTKWIQWTNIFAFLSQSFLLEVLLISWVLSSSNFFGLGFLCHLTGYILFGVVLRLKSRVSHKLGKCCTTELSSNFITLTQTNHGRQRIVVTLWRFNIKKIAI